MKSHIFVGVPFVITNGRLQDLSRNCISLWDNIAYSLREKYIVHFIAVPNLVTHNNLALNLSHCEGIVLQNPLGNNVSSSWNEIITYANAFCPNEDSGVVLIANFDVSITPHCVDALISNLLDRTSTFVMSGYCGTSFTAQPRIEFGVADFALFAMRVRDPRWDMIGPFDTNFAPAYWEDSDYQIRMKMQSVEFGTCLSCYFEHISSATIKHDAQLRANNDISFERNKLYLIQKWFRTHAAEAKALLDLPNPSQYADQLMQFCQLHPQDTE